MFLFHVPICLRIKLYFWEILEGKCLRNRKAWTLKSSVTGPTSLEPLLCARHGTQRQVGTHPSTGGNPCSEATPTAARERLQLSKLPGTQGCKRCTGLTRRQLPEHQAQGPFPYPSGPRPAAKSQLWRPAVELVLPGARGFGTQGAKLRAQGGRRG